MFYTYVLKSLKSGKLYVGYTNNLKNRIQRHDQGLVEATKNGRPWKIIYYEACNIKADAILREKALKTGFGRAYLNRRLSNA